MYSKRSFLLHLIFLNLQMDVCFIVPKTISDVEERFVKDNTEYIVYNSRVRWNEALTLCESHENGTLAIIDTNITRKFLAEALSETNLKLENLWIGAIKTVAQSDFTWIKSGEPVPDAYLLKRRKNAPSVTRNCLSFHRKRHDIPHFIDLQCELRRPFICQKNYDKLPDGSMTTSEWIRVGEYLYGIFYDEKTWKQSARECRIKHRAHLASFRNIKEIHVMGKFELIGRPSLENAWIGGYFISGCWKFIFDGSKIPNTVDPETLFPPWRIDKPVKRSGCLLLDRHLDVKNTTFLEGRCERKRSYICSKKIKPIPDFSVVTINNMGYIISFSKRDWADANDKCKSLNAKLVKVTPENLPDVIFIMAENATEVQHIWIGGRLSSNGTHFYWVSDKEILSKIRDSSNDFPPWYDDKYDPRYACLNMDRENHNTPVFYGANCETPQAFICQQDDITKLPKIPEEEVS